MRLLLVDNYDSYTYNLFHLAHAVAGEPPVVVRNDEYRNWSHLHASYPDVAAVLISPGPGHPGRRRDFGVSREALRSGLPTLGVCLGHQGLALEFGGCVTTAKCGPRHGITSPVRHLGNAGDPLFRGLPQEFAAMRYHSLDVRLPEASGTLVATAWAAEDGTIMGLRHLEKPLFGVQFHPESIATQYGAQLLSNFCTYALLCRGPSPRAGIPRPREVLAANLRPQFRDLFQYHGLKLHVRRLEQVCVPDESKLFRRICHDASPAFWLDSPASTHGTRARFSFMGDARGPRARLITYRLKPRRVIRVESPALQESRELFDCSIFDFLNYHLSQLRRPPTLCDGLPLPFDFDAGFVGYLGYELKADAAQSPASSGRHLSPHPDAAFLLADRVLVLDHRDSCVYLLCLSEEALDQASYSWLDEASSAVTQCRSDRPSSMPESAGLARPPVFSMERNEEEYIEDIDSALRAIYAGETYEVCLTNRIRSSSRPRNPLDLYRVLRSLNPAPRAAFLRLTSSLAVCCSSPESFLRVSAVGCVSSKPIKGTEPRGETTEEDRLIKRQLANSVKDRAENLMIVDLVRNDLGRVCRPGSVRVPKLTHIESYPTVHQMVSTVTGSLREGVSAVDAVRAAYPMGSMTGAPKLRTLEIIDELEHSPRGIYSGSIGFFGLSGGADLNVVIRTAVVTDLGVEVGVGGAIVALSDSAKEWKEIVLKGRALMRALAITVTGQSDYVLEEKTSGVQRRVPSLSLQAGHGQEPVAIEATDLLAPTPVDETVS
eukprot:CAMPEP_0198323562 /NCGR_PEP_ID=MMETSP1450-20131203/11773_1 /TAXON_ID=753684 ORGANISM="Madagascaria erythrocladiodes, Strain CCMP3234" /NCGR_SAMPLE_ID=MMETSP1450 /ASSEMBLY_ACC=CAM_ASM_001115 /LENGTH=772 /DNA_ID=CAMNT_0044027279 /DNA_START=37 /DNA_END=2355 /DNA_ORIENTATION=-